MWEEKYKFEDCVTTCQMKVEEKPELEADREGGVGGWRKEEVIGQSS